MENTSIVKGVIETDSGPIAVRELSYFLYHFRSVYVEALNLRNELLTDDYFHGKNIEGIAVEVSQRLGSQDRYKLMQNALIDLPPEQDLSFTQISRRNPLDVVFACVGVALAAAVILSGGEIKWDNDGFSVKLPPLGKGIAELKKAINGNYQKEDQQHTEDDSSSPSP